MPAVMRRAVVLILMVSLLTIGCEVEPEAPTPAPPQVTPDAHAEFLAQFDLTGLSIDPDRLNLGGPAKDGIPALVDPAVVPVGRGEFLPARSRIIVVTVNGETRGYPIAILNHHEIANDTLGGLPIAVVYCPRCDSVSVLDRRADGQILVFGVSGMLYNSNVVMYDRTDGALWSQVALQALSGPHAGRTLRHLPFTIVTAAAFAGEFPEATVLSLQTGFYRDYMVNPYAGYLVSDELAFPVEPIDERLPLKTPVIGLRVGNTVRAYPLQAVRSALDGRVIDPVGLGQFVLEASADRIDIVELPAGAAVVHTFWYAWAAMHTDTDIWASENP